MSTSNSYQSSDTSNDHKIHQKYQNHKQIIQKLATTSRSYRKISRSYFDIKTGILSIEEVLAGNETGSLDFNKGRSLLNHICQNNSAISDSCNEFASEIGNLHNLYSDLAKQKYERYSEEKEQFQHYVKKIGSLGQSTEKDREKYERVLKFVIENKEKLNSAKVDYDNSKKELYSFLTKINVEMEKIWEKTFIQFSSKFLTTCVDTITQTRDLIKSHKISLDDEIIIDEEDFDLSGSPKRSITFNLEMSNYGKEIEDYLLKIKNTEKSIHLADAFITKQQLSSSVSPIHKTHIEKMYGTNSVQLDYQPKQRENSENLMHSQENQISPNSFLHLKNKNGHGYQSVSVTNNFAFFDNILSEKSEGVKKHPKEDPIDIFNTNTHSKNNLSIPILANEPEKKRKKSEAREVFDNLFENMKTKKKDKEVDLLDL